MNRHSLHQLRGAAFLTAAMVLALVASGCKADKQDHRAAADAGGATAEETRGQEDASSSLAAGAQVPGGGSTQVRVVVPQDVLALAADLTAKHPNLDLVGYSEHEEMLAAMPGAHAVVGWNITQKTVRGSDNLEWVHVLTGGVNKFLTIPEIRDDPELVLTSMKIQKGPEVADHAMALLLGLTRNLPQFVRRMDQGEWDGRSDLPIIELRGKTMLIVGMGGIGTQIAERAHASGMRVIGTDAKDLPFMSAVEYVGQPDELLGLIPEADVVTIAAPLTATTENLIDEEVFSAMRDGAYLISVSRGEIVETDALVEALRTGKLTAAGLDVVNPEPLPRDHPLWSMPNVIITPHFAGRSDGRVIRQQALILENIDRFMRGLPLKNRVDKAKGF